ncbi:MAG: hypothetical protein JXR96_28885 [Deltaproteobacteria bacterium]|nr:hypothetical protein [Deltaproteobacteria bacterium]
MIEAISDFYALGFPIRIALLLLVLLSIAAVSHLVSGGRTRRWREYGFWLLVGLGGAVYACLNDLVTYQLSPEYFTLGKGLHNGAVPVWLQVQRLAAEAGFVAGMLIGGALLMANNPGPDRPALHYRRLARFVLWPVAGAILVALALAAIPGLDVFGQRSDLARLMGVQAAADFLLVNRIHLGHYAGAVIGTVVGAARIRAARRRA